MDFWNRFKVFVVLMRDSRVKDKGKSLQPDMRYTSNGSYVTRILDGLNNNRVTDFEMEGASPMLRKTITGASHGFSKDLIHKSGRNANRSFKSLTNQNKRFQSQDQDSSIGSQKRGVVLSSKQNPLRMSLPSKGQNGFVSGKDIRPDLHHKTYFKATTSVYIQNSPKTIRRKSQPRVNLKANSNHRFSTMDPKSVASGVKREGTQAYDSNMKA